MRDVTTAAMPQQSPSRAMRFMVASVLVVAAAGASVNVHAQGMGGPGGHGHGPGGGMTMFGGSPEHVGRGVDRLLDGLGATDVQRAQIKQIGMAAASDLKAQHESGRALREKGVQIFAAPTVDAAAAESLRQQMLAQHDQASKRTLQAMLDVSKVLTPEQRATMAARMQREQRDHGPRPQK